MDTAEYQEKLDELEAKNCELLTWRPTLQTCPNVSVWKEKCRTILKEYEQFVESTKLDEIPNQGKYLLPLEKLLENNLSEQQHENPFFKCSYAGGYIKNQTMDENQQNEKPTTKLLSANVSPTCSHLFLPTDTAKNDNDNVSDTPFAITTCDCAPEFEQADESEADKSIISCTTSLSSFEYKSRHYASIKVYTDNTHMN